MQSAEGENHAICKCEVVDGVFPTEEKREMAKALTDVMVRFEGSEAFREVVWVPIELLHCGWHTASGRSAWAEVAERVAFRIEIDSGDDRWQSHNPC
jgi:phenylpyruvate tautomerase PptA (4-oxalocrotonate tautomerase family)